MALSTDPSQIREASFGDSVHWIPESWAATRPECLYPATRREATQVFPRVHSIPVGPGSPLRALIPALYPARHNQCQPDIGSASSYDIIYRSSGPQDGVPERLLLAASTSGEDATLEMWVGSLQRRWILTMCRGWCLRSFAASCPISHGGHDENGLPCIMITSFWT